MNPLHVLLIDDEPDDGLLIERHLTAHFQGGGSLWRVDTAPALIQALVESWSVILCDYAVPSMPWPMALRICQTYRPTTPFIVVSGVLPSNWGQPTFEQGVDGFVNKNTLDGLGPYVERVIQAKKSHDALGAAADKLDDEIRKLGESKNAPE